MILDNAGNLPLDSLIGICRQAPPRTPRSGVSDQATKVAESILGGSALASSSVRQQLIGKLVGLLPWDRACGSVIEQP